MLAGMCQTLYTARLEVNSCLLVSGEEKEFFFFFAAVPLLHHNKIGCLLTSPPLDELLCEIRQKRLTTPNSAVSEDTYLRRNPLTLNRH